MPSFEILRISAPRRLLPLLFVACGESGGAKTPDAHPVDTLVPAEDAPIASDLVATDGAPAIDAAPPDAAVAPPADAAPPDALPPDAAPPPPPPTCPPPDESPPPAAGRWALSLFHFNVQYVAGGSEGFAEIALRNPGSARTTDFSEADLEDRIIVESYEPLVDMLREHPDLALTTEMQGYMVDLIRERHPALLAKMQALVAGGQLELASIHWSDQFFLAFGQASLEEGWARTEASFAAADLPLSPVVFTQEGQFGPGFGAWLARTRPGAVMVMPRNLAGFFQQGLQDVPYFTMRGLDVVLPRGVSDATVTKFFHFFDDGELLATGGLDPYFGTVFAHRPVAVANYAHELGCLVENGYRVGRVADYLAAVKDTGFAPPEMPPFLDGTWQPGSTRGSLRWMGGGAAFKQHERDNEILTACVAAERALMALEVVTGARPDGPWRDLLWGQVSDARGLNPWWGEVQYGLRHCGAARDAATAALVAEVNDRGAAALAIDTASGEVREVEPAGPPAPEPEVPAPFEVRVESAPRAATVRWTQPEGDPHLWHLTVDFPADAAYAADYEACLAQGRAAHLCDDPAVPLKLILPRDPGLIAVRPAFAEDLERYTEAEFQLAPDAYEDAAWLPVNDGWVDLGGFHVLKDIGVVHLAFGFPAGEGRNGEVWMLDETWPSRQAGTWRLTVTDDAARARAEADRNLRPVVVVSADAAQP